MRLIFDQINGTSTSIPDALPEWLVPSSQARLVTVIKNGNGLQTTLFLCTTMLWNFARTLIGMFHLPTAGSG